MELNPVLLSRLQFAFTISFHVIFPSFTIGLAAYLATRKGHAQTNRLERDNDSKKSHPALGTLNAMRQAPPPARSPA
jgi:cytochrome bd-type quinol oxidase subunit 1